VKVKKKDSESGAIRNVYALGLVSFFTDISSEMCFSLLPTFIVGLPGSGAAILGLIEGFAEALSYDLRAVSGIFSDKFRKRKVVVLVGYSFSNVVKPLFAVAQSAFDALVIRVADRVGKGVRTSPRDALLTESVSEKRRGAAFGLHRTLDQTGAILGPLIASASMLLLGLTVRDIFWLSFIPGFMGILVLLFLVQERISKTTAEFELLRGVRTILRGDFPLLLLVVGLFSLGAFNYSFVLLNAKEANIADALIPSVYALINVAHTLIAIPSGLIADRIVKEKVLVVSYGTFLASALLILLWPGDYLFAFLIAVVFGIYDGITNTVTRALVPRYAEAASASGATNLGTAYGVYYIVVGSSFFVANTIFGTLWQYFGSSAAAIYSITLSSAAIVGMILFLGYQKRNL
jgi:MFS family permease